MDDSASGNLGGEGFLQRWSRRKVQARKGGTPPEEPPEPLGEGEQEAAPEENGEAPLTDADMPALEELGEDSDVSAFFAAGVSDELRQAALRRLFRAPKFNRRDGLEVYDGDYRSFEHLGDMVTADMRHRLEQQGERLTRALEGKEADAPAPGDENRAAGEEGPEGTKSGGNEGAPSART